MEDDGSVMLKCEEVETATPENEYTRIFARGNADYADISSLLPAHDNVPVAVAKKIKESLLSFGFFEPLTVDNSKAVLNGTKRLFAAKLAGITHLPVTYDESYNYFSDELFSMLKSAVDFFAASDIMNILATKLCIPRDTIAARTGLSVSAVSNKIRLSSFSESERAHIRKYEMTERHARALLKLDKSRRSDAVSYIGSKKLSVADSEEYIDSILTHSLSFSEVVRKLSRSVFSAGDTANASGVKCNVQSVDKPDRFVITLQIYK